jgi:hypothetical protein
MHVLGNAGRWRGGAILLARLAVDRSVQGHGYGRALMADAAIRTLQASDLVGARAMLVHARDQRAAGFYERLGFTRSSTDALHLTVTDAVPSKRSSSGWHRPRHPDIRDSYYSAIAAGKQMPARVADPISNLGLQRPRSVGIAASSGCSRQRRHL